MHVPTHTYMHTHTHIHTYTCMVIASLGDEISLFNIGIILRLIYAPYMSPLGSDWA